MYDYASNRTLYYCQDSLSSRNTCVQISVRMVLYWVLYPLVSESADDHPVSAPRNITEACSLLDLVVFL